jgi:hypothetical protein
MENKLVVEWFANRISHGGLVSKKQFNDLLEQAKQMEKEQKKELVIGTYIDLKIKNNKLPYGLEYLNKLAKVEEKAKQYYNEKFTNLSELPISSKQQEQ